MFASFHSKGTIPSCGNMLYMCASGVLICSTVYFSILGDIPSTPGDFFSFIFHIVNFASYYFWVITNCPNISPSDPLNFVSGTGNGLVSSRVQCRIHSVADVAYATGPATEGAPRFYLEFVLQE